VNSFENEAIKKFLNTFQRRNPDKMNMMALKIFEKITSNFWIILKRSTIAVTCLSKSFMLPTVMQNYCS